jgi:hypothetical protein
MSIFTEDYVIFSASPVTPGILPFLLSPFPLSVLIILSYHSYSVISATEITLLNTD